MTDFEFLYGFFGLLIGLIVAQLATRFTDAIEEREDRPIGLLTPLLALFVLLDISSFWLIAWSVRDVAVVSWRTVFATMTMAMIYFMAASLVLPRAMAKWNSLDDHYWHRKQLVLGGILFVNLVSTGFELTRNLPSPTDLWFFIMQGSYFGALIILLLSRVRWLDLTLLLVLLANMILGGFQLVPHSQWAESVKIASKMRSHCSGRSPGLLPFKRRLEREANRDRRMADFHPFRPLATANACAPVTSIDAVSGLLGAKQHRRVVA